MNSSRNQKSQYARTPVCRSFDGWKKAPLMAVTMPYRKFQVTQVSSHTTTITTTSYTEPHTYKYLQKRHINLWDPRYTHIINHLQWLMIFFDSNVFMQNIYEKWINSYDSSTNIQKFHSVIILRYIGPHQLVLKTEISCEQ